MRRQSEFEKVGRKNSFNPHETIVDMQQPSDEWMKAANDAFSAAGVPHRERPWRAWKQLAREMSATLMLTDEPVRRLFEWFSTNNRSDSQFLGPMFLGAFYYDAEVWPLEIPVIFGTVSIDLSEAVRGMPDGIRLRLAQDIQGIELLRNTFASCFDVAVEVTSLTRSPRLWPHARQLLSAGTQTLMASTDVLLAPRPNSKALGPLRSVVEIYLKAFISHHNHLNDTELQKQFGHKLDELIKAAIGIAPTSDFSLIKPNLAIFPGVVERYSDAEYPLQTLWDAYALALFTAATVVRQLSGKDFRVNMNKT